MGFRSKEEVIAAAQEDGGINVRWHSKRTDDRWERTTDEEKETLAPADVECWMLYSLIGSVRAEIGGTTYLGVVPFR